MALSIHAAGAATVNPQRTNPMTAFKMISRLREDEDGAVTVDWVVLTAAVVGLCVTVLASVTSGTKSATHNVSNKLTSTSVSKAF